MFLFARGECLPWQPGSQRCPCYHAGDTPYRLSSRQCAIGQRFGQIPKPICHCLSPCSSILHFTQLTGSVKESITYYTANNPDIGESSGRKALPRPNNGT